MSSIQLPQKQELKKRAANNIGFLVAFLKDLAKHPERIKAVITSVGLAIAGGYLLIKIIPIIVRTIG